METKTIETPYGSEEVCPKCGGDVHWEDCYNCEEGYSHHDCGEDTCCCLDKSPNVICDICNGKGGWFNCLSCNQKNIQKEDLEKNGRRINML